MSILSTGTSTSFLSSVELSPDQIFDGNGRHRLICVEEDGMSSSFVLHFLLGDFLNWNTSKADKTLQVGSESSTDVVLVLTANSLSHWTTIASRIGPQLTRLIQTGRVKVIDPLEELYATLITSSDNPAQLNPLSTLYTSLQDLKPSCVIIEDLQFFTASCSPSEVLRFLAKLRRLPMSVILGQVPSPLGQILASTRFLVTALETGSSSNVSGVLHLTSARQLRSFHYKLDERSIKVSFVPRSK